MFHVKLSDKRPQKFTPTSETRTGRGLQRISKSVQMDIGKLYNLSRVQGAARFVATKATIFFVKFTIIVLAGIHSKIKTKAHHVNWGGKK